MSANHSILILCGTSEPILDHLGKLETDHEFKIRHVSSVDEAFHELATTSYQLLCIDLDVQKQSTIVKSIEGLLGHHPSLQVIPLLFKDNIDLLQSFGNIKINGFITKPYTLESVSLLLHNILTCHTPRTGEKRKKAAKGGAFHGMIGNSRQMQKLYDLISKIADDDQSTVLIRGESGTGKELVAKAIHSHSRRKTKKFVPVNCAAIPDDLLESELFGHVKGAFTGANTNKQGRIQYADGGTLFLDEIGDMKSSLQAKLLRVLQEKEFEPVGALHAIPVDTRIVAATHCDLEKLVNEGSFREDLYYRLCVIPVHLPPLTERKEDIILLLEEFINRYAKQRNRQPFVLSKQVLDCLLSHRWRGNVRELENFVQHMSILYSGQHVKIDDIPDKYKPLEYKTPYREKLSPADESVMPDEKMALHTGLFSSPSPDTGFADNDIINFKEKINEFECQLITRAMKKTNGNKKEAARLLSLKRTTLLEKIKKKGLLNL